MKPTISRANLMRIFNIADDRTFNDYVKRGFFKQMIVSNNIVYDVENICERLGIDNINDPILTTEEVAANLGLKNKTVISMAQKGILPSYKFESGRKRRLYFLKRQIDEHKKLKVEFRYDIVNRYSKLVFYRGVMLTLLETKPFCNNFTDTEKEVMHAFFVDNETLQNIGVRYNFTKQCTADVIEAASNKLLNNIVELKDKLNKK